MDCRHTKGQKGFYFSGEYTYISGAPKVFLPAAGYRQSSGSAGYRTFEGYYWCISPLRPGITPNITLSATATMMMVMVVAMIVVMTVALIITTITTILIILRIQS